MRRRDQKLSLTEIVWKRSPPGDSEGSDHSAHPAFSAPGIQPSTPSTFRPRSPTFDQRASFTPPIFNRSTPSDGLYSSGGSPSEFWDEIYAVDGRGYISGTPNVPYPARMNTNGLPRATDERSFTVWTGDLALSNDLSGFDIDPWTPDYLLATELETAPFYNDGAHSSIMPRIVQ